MRSGRRLIFALLVVGGGLIALLVLVWAVSTWPARQRAGGEEMAQQETLALTPSPTLTVATDKYAQERESMVTWQIDARGVHGTDVLRAMRTVPRHEFVPEDYLGLAYSDRPLPIGYGQTISQPYIVALMTELLELENGDSVLEIGTGSGYQAAILAEIVDDVYTVEIIPELAQEAKERLDRLGYERVHALNADGYYGWKEHAPYDAVIVTAAPDHVPQPLLQQLKDGGRMVIPVGPVGAFQTLWLVTKEAGEVEFYNKGGVTFVPLTGEH